MELRVSKRAEKMAENRQKLILAGRKAFAESGYARASMDKLTADVGLTRGALYHNFGDKRGLFAAVVDQIDSEIAAYAKAEGENADNAWHGLMAEGEAYIKKALDPEVQQIVLRDGPAVLGDPSQWPSQNRCLAATRATLALLQQQGQLKSVDIDMAARFINGAAMNAALWIAASDEPEQLVEPTTAALNLMLAGFLNS